MATSLAHRGPDDEGVWVDAHVGVALGHRRLSILDLSTEGHQPMVSASGRYVVVFNGEIYNFQELRSELERTPRAAVPAFRGHSDTEVMLAAFEQWGVEEAVARFNGMFAFIVWDREERLLHLVRDRLGEKPLFYAWMGNTFLFGSELKALRCHPDFRAEIDRDALALYMKFGYVPAADSIYRGTYKLPPGCLLTVAVPPSERPEPASYWSARDVAEDGVANPFPGSLEEVIARLEDLLRDSIRLRMVADVPLGVLLSGGIDSSTVTALMQAQSTRPIKTFSIGFKDPEFNEATHAAGVARHLGTDHTELYVTPGHALAVIPRLPTIYDEPFADSSQIPTFLVCSLARKHVKVGLSGDGGDEVFGGYNRHVWGPRIWKTMRWIPKGVRKKVAAALTVLSPQEWDTAFQKMEVLLPEIIKQTHPGDKLHKLAEIGVAENPEAMYEKLVSHWNGAESLVLGTSGPSALYRGLGAELPDFTQRMMYLDTVTYLPDDILVKVDRASMSVSLETRVPFLDHRVVEFAWKLPSAMKIRNGQGKRLLRQILHQHVPKKLTERPKAGFAIPLADWLRGPLRDWAEALLDERRLEAEGFLAPKPIRDKWVEHLSSKRNWVSQLWNVLMFQAWLETN